MKIDGDLLERLAEQDHEIWMEEKKRQGFHHPKNCQYAKGGVAPAYGKYCDFCHLNLVDYSKLSEHEKELDRIRWRNLDEQLEMVGLKVVPL